MELPEALGLRGAFKAGGTGVGPVVKRARVIKKIAPKTRGTIESSAKEKGASSTQGQPQEKLPSAPVTTVTIHQALPPLPRHVPPSNPQLIQGEGPII